MSETFNKVVDWCLNNWQAVLTFVTTPLFSGISIWGIVKFIIYLVKRKKQKTSDLTSINAKMEALDKKFVELQGMIEQIPGNVQKSVEVAQENAEQQKQAIYKSIITGKEQIEQNVREIVEEVKETIIEVQNEGKIDTVATETKEVEQIIEEEPVTETKSNIVMG